MITVVSAVKFLHVVAVIVWLGGVASLTVLNLRLARTASRDALSALSDASEFYGRVVVGPAAALTLLAGIATTLSAGFRFGSLWITWGFAAILLSVLLGATLIRMTTARLRTAATAGDGAGVPVLQRRLKLLNGLNMLLLLSTVWAMVAKPTL
jgi:uncharacterized membrane protein